MKSSSTALLVTLLAVAVCAASAQVINIGFDGNVTLDNFAAGQFGFRETFSGAASSVLVGSVFGFESVASEVTPGTNGSASFNVSASAAWVSSGLGSLFDSSPPSGYLAWFQSSVNWNLSDPKFNAASADVSASAGVIASSYYALVDYETGSGKVNNIMYLGDANLVWTLNQGKSSDSGLAAYTMRGTQILPLKSNFSIEVSYIMTNRVGRLNVGHAVVTPNSVEVVVNITNFPYASNTSSCVLLIAVAAAGADASVSGQIVANAGANQTYFNMATNANADANIVPVKISAWAEGNSSASFSLDKTLSGQMKARYGAGFSVKLVNVTFPAQAKSIIYDPSMGAGPMPQVSTGGSGLGLGAIIGIVVAGVVGVAVIVALGFYLYNRSGSSKTVSDTYRPLA
eukprot:gnl/Hemi2/5816_TR2009_c0_g1_i1.p1 gnl/Hemi2/5816_TR2009_c0_g1~~gnl/Hemi2/5816_TR2009_c0_g1_i1.p1  ORF type:complete len:400 (+),score=175.09 gnl/Hemi2/5816_TR2009_c0_g1_i1:138-1337(+)